MFALYIFSNLVFHECTKCIKLDYHFFWDELQALRISPNYIPLTLNQLIYLLKLWSSLNFNFSWVSLAFAVCILQLEGSVEIMEAINLNIIVFISFILLHFLYMVGIFNRLDFSWLIVIVWTPIVYILVLWIQYSNIATWFNANYSLTIFLLGWEKYWFGTLRQMRYTRLNLDIRLWWTFCIT